MEVGNKSRSIGGHHSSARLTDEWLTPLDWIKGLGPFDLDPCAPETRPWDTADEHYTIAEDGLSLPWSGLVWCNPPYSAITPWAKRCAEHGNGFLMVFARTETAWFHEWIWPYATSVFFLRGRVNFCTPSGIRASKNAGGPSIVAAYGKTAAVRLSRLVYPGYLVTLDSRKV